MSIRSYREGDRGEISTKEESKGERTGWGRGGGTVERTNTSSLTDSAGMVWPLGQGHLRPPKVLLQGTKNGWHKAARP